VQHKQQEHIMAKEVALPWGNNQVDFALSQEIVGLSFTTPAVLPQHNIQLKVFEIGGSPPSLMKAVFSQVLGDMVDGMLVAESSIAIDAALTCQPTQGHPKHKHDPVLPPKPAQLRPQTKYYLNVQSLDTSQPSFEKRATIHVPK
jgi:hypothetical protein